MKIPHCDGSASDCNRTLKEYRKLQDMWFYLKEWVADTGISVKDSPSKDYQTGHNEALEGILHHMKILEEK